MMRLASCCWMTGIAAAITLAFCTAANAGGSDYVASQYAQRSRDILDHIDTPPNEPGWIARYVALDYKSGIRISRAVSYGEHRFDLRLRGPIYKTPVRGKNYGLKLELKF